LFVCNPYYLDEQKMVAVCVGDASQADTIAKGFAVARDVFGKPVDLVVLNAGRGLPGSILNSAVEKWDELFELDLLGVLKGLRVAAKAMLEDFPNASAGPAGATGDWLQHARDIFVIGSNVGRHVAPHVPVYGTTKAGVMYAGA
jgi:NAD(P)-dependent dehydrogenase (short-subunit alcohol dehydrogenase family)